MILYNFKLKKRILVTGANGMVGQNLIKFFSNKKDFEVLGTSLEEKSFLDSPDYVQCNLTVRDDIKEIIYSFYPDVIINTAAFTNVDKNETERELAWKLNVKALESIADAARVQDIHVIHFSTDYVFDGSNGPYDEAARPNPLGYYGRTKLASENALKISGAYSTIIRTNVLYGITYNSRPDFVQWLYGKLKNNEAVNIVIDQINNPTFIDDIVSAINKIIDMKKYGLYNIGGKEFLSRFDFSLKIADYFGLDKNLIHPITTEELNQPAKRPLKSGLITLKAEAELGYKPHTINETLFKMKRHLMM